MESLKLFLLRLDLEIWMYLNTQWHTPFLDALLPFFRNQYFWVPVYLFLLVFTTLNFGRRGWYWCLGFLATFGLTDFISASLIKPAVGRLRPCNTPFLQEYVHLLVECGSGLSFPSSHASNHFGMAAFIAVTLGPLHPAIRGAAFLWAAVIAYAQVYVGVHFPFDVLFGAALGTLIGTLTGRAFRRLLLRFARLPAPPDAGL